MQAQGARVGHRHSSMHTHTHTHTHTQRERERERGLFNNGAAKEVGVPSPSRRAHRRGSKKRALIIIAPGRLRVRAESRGTVVRDSRHGTTSHTEEIADFAVFMAEALSGRLLYLFYDRHND